MSRVDLRSRDEPCRPPIALKAPYATRLMRDRAQHGPTCRACPTRACALEDDGQVCSSSSGNAGSEQRCWSATPKLWVAAEQDLPSTAIDTANTLLQQSSRRAPSRAEGNRSCFSEQGASFSRMRSWRRACGQPCTEEAPTRAALDDVEFGKPFSWRRWPTRNPRT